MMNRLRNRASPMITWFGGIACRPSALRVIDRTITIRVKLVSMISSAGAIPITVSSTMIVMLWLGDFLPPKSSEMVALPSSAAVAAAGAFGALGATGAAGAAAAGPA